MMTIDELPTEADDIVDSELDRLLNWFIQKNKTKRFAWDLGCESIEIAPEDTHQRKPSAEFLLGDTKSNFKAKSVTFKVWRYK